jgi:superfamily I DNA/RNA helicase
MQVRVLIISCAYSGKTHAITARITHLILNRVAQPSSIIALTFTTKSSQELRHRITNFLGELHEMQSIGTFHAYCLHLLKTPSEYLTAPSFSILDEKDQQKIITNIIKRNGLSKQIAAKQVFHQIPLINSQSISPGEKKQRITLTNRPKQKSKISKNSYKELSTLKRFAQASQKHSLMKSLYCKRKYKNPKTDDI